MYRVSDLGFRSWGLGSDRRKAFDKTKHNAQTEYNPGTGLTLRLRFSTPDKGASCLGCLGFEGSYRVYIEII